MQANKFVKEYGWLRATQVLKYSQPSHASFLADRISTTYSDKESENLYSIAELKRLVESKAWVDEHGTIEHAKEYANSPYTAPEIKERLLQAITDVESCQ